jgi:hypothetical protein
LQDFIKEFGNGANRARLMAAGRAGARVPMPGGRPGAARKPGASRLGAALGRAGIGKQAGMGALGKPPQQMAKSVSDWTGSLAIENLRRRARTIKKQAKQEQDANLKALEQIKSPDDDSWTI